MFRFHIFLEVKISYRNIEVKKFHLVICPFRVKEDQDYRKRIEEMIDQSRDPIIDQQFNDIEILLADMKAISILKNTMLSLDERYYQLLKNNCMLITIPIKAPMLQIILVMLEGIKRQVILPKSLYCQFCKDSA